MREPEEFTWEKEPKGLPGWYATIHCWDPEEGTFPGANYWDGDKWDGSSIIAYAGPFESKGIACKWAYDHDPEAE